MSRHGRKASVIVPGVVDVDLQTRAEFADVLLKCRFEPALAQAATFQPLRRELVHRGAQSASVDVRRTEQF